MFDALASLLTFDLLGFEPASRVGAAVHFFVMRYVDGKPLQEHVRQLRRTEVTGPTAGKLEFEGLSIDTETRAVSVDGNAVEAGCTPHSDPRTANGHDLRKADFALLSAGCKLDLNRFSLVG